MRQLHRGRSNAPPGRVGSHAVAPVVHDPMTEARRRTLALVAHLDPAELELVLTPLLSPLAWDIGHIAAYEDLWINHRLGGRPLLRPGLAELYDAFETPRSSRGTAEYLRGEDLWAYLEEVRARSAEVSPEDDVIHEMVLRHELQHTETMLQAMALGGRLPEGWGRPQPLDAPGDLDFLPVAAGPVLIGAPEDGFAYDNERPRHEVDVPAFAIARTPVTNAGWRAFVADGGYARRDLWSSAGWSWLQGQVAGELARVADGDPAAPVVHVSGHEASAFARAHHARLPSEHEWEKAASGGLLEGIGAVWEWTRTRFDGYPGFRAHPYREYSEVFFGRDYRVLRGWSCVTAERVASIHFRNWDLPQRRQLFAGLRLVEGDPA
jgi:iron(II)-dependent oxidoreductase